MYCIQLWNPQNMKDMDVEMGAEKVTDDKRAGGLLLRKQTEIWHCTTCRREGSGETRRVDFG